MSCRTAYNTLFPEISFNINGFNTTCRDIFTGKMLSDKYNGKFYLTLRLGVDITIASLDMLDYISDTLNIKIKLEDYNVDRNYITVIKFKVDTSDSGANPRAIVTFLRNIQVYFLYAIHLGANKIIDLIGMEEFHKRIYFLSAMLRYSKEFRLKFIPLFKISSQSQYYLVADFYSVANKIVEFLTENYFRITDILNATGLSSLFYSVNTSNNIRENASYSEGLFYTDIVIYDAVKSGNVSLEDISYPLHLYYKNNKRKYQSYDKFAKLYEVSINNAYNNKSSVESYKSAQEFYEYMENLFKRTYR